MPREFDLPQWFREAVARKADAEFTGTFSEVESNGRSINWRYWMSMKTLSAGQAARLMVGLDPDIFASLNHNGPTRNDTSKHRDIARDIERLALNLGMTEAPASEWVSWAKRNGFRLHKLFVVEVEGREANSEATNTDAAATSESAKPIPRQRFQEMEILRVISELGHEPKKLPKDIPGKPGVKADVRTKLTFAPGVFDKAWERLAKMNDIGKLK